MISLIITLNLKKLNLGFRDHLEPTCSAKKVLLGFYNYFLLNTIYTKVVEVLCAEESLTFLIFGGVGILSESLRARVQTT